MDFLRCDSHVHVDRLDRDVLAADPLAADAGWRALVPGIEPGPTRAALDATGDPRLRWAAAVHPWFVGDHEDPRDDARWGEVEALAADPRICAVGETGLDVLRVGDDAAHAARVEAWFLAHVELAVRVDKPLVIHCVRALHRLIELLRARRDNGLRGVVHAFSGSVEQAAELARLGFSVGIGPAVTRERSRRVRAAAAGIPSDALLLETDAPYMAAAPRGRDEGRPADLIAVAEHVAALRGVSVDAVWAANARGFERLFGEGRVAG